MKIKKGDKVRVIAGAHKGQEGLVIKTLPKVGRVIIEGVNKVKVHNKPKNNNGEGSITEKEGSIHVSNVALIDPTSKSKKTIITKVGYKIEDGQKVRFARKTGTVIK